VGKHAAAPESENLLGQEFSFQLGRMRPYKTQLAVKSARRIRIGLPFMDSGASFLSRLRQSLKDQSDKGLVPLRILVGDLRDLRYHADPQGVLWAIATAAMLLRELGIPLVLYETVESLNSGSVSIAQADVAILYDDTATKTSMLVEGLATSSHVRIYGSYEELVNLKR
jgi:hypothetical protein